MVTFHDIAEELDMDFERVRGILTEDPDIVASESEKDTVFQTARSLGYDFSKLKIGKRMRYRKNVIEDLMDDIQNHPEWDRDDILDHLEESWEWVDRVTYRTFEDEFDTSIQKEKEQSEGDENTDPS